MQVWFTDELWQFFGTTRELKIIWRKDTVIENFVNYFCVHRLNVEGSKRCTYVSNDREEKGGQVVKLIDMSKEV